MTGLRATIVCLFVGLLSSTAAPLDFARDIRPLLSDACYNCHGPDTKARKAGLRLDDRVAAHDSGVLTNGEMLRRLTTTDPDERMPPPESIRTLTDEQRAKLAQWLRAGAAWPSDDRHWAFVPPKRPPLAKVNDSAWPRNSIDHFILARLESEQLAPSSEADKATLLRRVSFDLTGLPPTVEALDAFLADTSPQAFERAVDRLLDSPRYGEYMALGWLEASRYADTDGYQNDRLRYMWVWRDWVIQAFNDNMPFDRFVTEQMAGDLLPDRNFFTQVATGYNRNHRINSEGGSIPDEWIVEYVADRVETMGTMFLGLTLNCARCHDHKYDPIAQKDFYRLFAFFNGIDEAGLGPNNGNSPPFIPVPKNWPILSRDEAKFVVPEPMKIKVIQTSVPRPQPGSPETVMVMHELAKPRPTHVLNRGQYDQPNKSETLHPATPPVLGAWNKKWPGDRIGLARWLIDPKHPLTARVLVNRFWLHHFGRGLVDTPGDFGRLGELPSHPELLDWLAADFMKNGWRLKRLHKLIMTSQAYQQVSRRNAKQDALDPDNRLLGRMNVRRMEAETIRDAMLALSGQISLRLGGKPVPVMEDEVGQFVIGKENLDGERKPGKAVDLQGAQHRRSLYVQVRRTRKLSFLDAFDAPAMEPNCAKRPVSTVAPQALIFMNNAFVISQSRAMAERLQAAAKDDLDAQLTTGWHHAFGRAATPEQLSKSREFVHRQTALFKERKDKTPELTALANYCQALMSANKFVYVE